MQAVLITVTVLILLIIAYVISIAGRTDNPDAEKFVGVRYAHRGLHSKPARPENSLAAFSAAADRGYGIELDVHLMKDGRLAVIHDSSLERTAGADVRIEELTAAELDGYRLENTAEHIPTLKEVLELVDGRVPLLIELKSAGNIAPLCSALVDELRDYKGDFCIESFDPRCVLWFKKNAPDIVRGQLTENFLRDRNSGVSLPLGILLTVLVFNIATQPDFIAQRFSDRRSLPNMIARNFWNMKGFVWTVTDPEDLKQAEKEGYSVIFEDFEP